MMYLELCPGKEPSALPFVYRHIYKYKNLALIVYSSIFSKFYSVPFRGSTLSQRQPPQVFYRKAVLKNFRKGLRWSPFLKELNTPEPQTPVFNLESVSSDYGPTAIIFHSYRNCNNYQKK